MSIFDKVFNSSSKVMSPYLKKVEQINSLEDTLSKLSNKQLKAKTAYFKDQISQGKNLDELLAEAFACVREASKRAIGQRHYDVQLIGGIVLHEGKIAEMKTGEGKTLVATLALYLNALEGKGVHLVTVNDFLAKFQAQWMGKIFDLLDISVGAIGQQQDSFVYSPTQVSSDDPTWHHLLRVDRATAYKADITYGTNNEFGFDYLRDNMVYSLDQKVQRELNFAIVDEVDSILIDEARTPLIISSQAQESGDLYVRFSNLVSKLQTEDYEVDEKDRHVAATESGIAKIEQWLGIKNLYDSEHIDQVHHLEEALKAHFLFRIDKDYVVKDGEIIIVDEFTGRLMHGRRYSEGLHQAIEAKEGVVVNRESETMATISFQNLFRLYKKLSGMTGTASTEAEEFHKIYKLDVMEIPTNKPMLRVDTTDKIFKTEEAKLQAIVNEVKSRNELGQPILIGTVSIEKNELISNFLSKSGVPHNVLNAKQHEREAKIIAQAGRLGSVTVATNIAGRGIDIILGGTPPSSDDSDHNKDDVDVDEEDLGLAVLARDTRTIEEWQTEHEKVIEFGGLHVIGTDRHESRRIDNQLRGRAGRQGDPGSSQFYVSMEDDLMRIFGGDRMKSLMDRLGLPDDVPIENNLVARSIESAQKKVESHNFDIRKHLIDYDDVMNKHRQAIYRKRNLILTGKSINDSNEEMDLHNQIIELMTDEEIKTIDQKIKIYGIELVKNAEQLIYLRVIDRNWVEHLTSMEQLRHGIGLRGYGQKDPLVEYKKAAYEMYQALVERVEDETVELLLRLEIQQNPNVQPVNNPIATTLKDNSQEIENTSSFIDSQKVEENDYPSSQPTTNPGSVSITVRKKGQITEQTPLNPQTQFGYKVGRNDPCPCGATKEDGRPKKYKQCHGK